MKQSPHSTGEDCHVLFRQWALSEAKELEIKCCLFVGAGDVSSSGSSAWGDGIAFPRSPSFKPCRGQQAGGLLERVSSAIPEFWSTEMLQDRAVPPAGWLNVPGGVTQHLWQHSPVGGRCILSSFLCALFLRHYVSFFSREDEPARIRIWPGN